MVEILVEIFTRDLSFWSSKNFCIVCRIRKTNLWYIRFI